MEQEIKKFEIPDSIVRPLSNSLHFYILISCFFLHSHLNYSLEPLIGNDLDHFLVCLEQAFVEREKLESYANVYTNIIRLTRAKWNLSISTACNHLENLYEPCLQLYINDAPYEQDAFSFNFPDNKNLEQVQKVQAFLEKENITRYRTTYINLRKTFIQKQLASMNLTPIKETSKETSAKDGVYITGTHPILPFITTILSLLLYEKALMTKCLTFKSTEYAEIIDEYRKQLIYFIHYVLNKHVRVTDHEFLVMDVAGLILKQRKHFTETLGSIDRGLTEIAEEITTAANAATFDYIIFIDFFFTFFYIFLFYFYIFILFTFSPSIPSPILSTHTYIYICIHIQFSFNFPLFSFLFFSFFSVEFSQRKREAV